MGVDKKGNDMTTSSARLMLFSRAQEVLGIQEAEVLMDMLTPGEMFDAWRSDTQAGFSLVRSQLEISEAAVKKEIVGVHQRIDSLELDLRELRNKLIRLFGFDIDTVNVESKQGSFVQLDLFIVGDPRPEVRGIFFFNYFFIKYLILIFANLGRVKTFISLQKIFTPIFFFACTKNIFF